MGDAFSEAYLKPAWAWYTRYCNPVVAYLYRGDRAGARAHLSEAWQSIDEAELNDDQRQTMRYRLYYVAWMEPLRLGTREEARAGFTQLCARLSEPPAGPLSAAMQQRMQLQAGCLADTEGIATFSPAEYERLRAGLPELMLDPELYHFASSWAFSHQRQDVLEEALEVLTFNSSGYQSDFSWMRANLMHLLLQHKAIDRDVLELIKRLEYPHQWRVVRDTLWNAVEAAGLAPEGGVVDAALTARLKVLEAMEPCEPQRRPRTARVRKDLGPQ